MNIFFVITSVICLLFFVNQLVWAETMVQRLSSILFIVMNAFTIFILLPKAIG